MAEQYEWKSDYSVGIRLLDYDHQELFDVVNELQVVIEQGNVKTEIAKIVGRLSKYALQHFQREEHIMHEYQFPEIVSHRQRHHEFAHLVHAIRHVLANCPEKLSSEKLHAYLGDWLVNHILGEDMQYRDYFRGDYGRRKTDINQPINEGFPRPVEERRRKSDWTSVSVSVPVGAENILRRCARILQLGGDRAEMLEELTDPIGEISSDQAEKIAAIVLD